MDFVSLDLSLVGSDDCDEVIFLQKILAGFKSVKIGASPGIVDFKLFVYSPVRGVERVCP
jgi:hypothetical protein